MKKTKIIIAALAITNIITLSVAINTARINNRMLEWYATREVATVRVQQGEGMDTYWAANAPSWMSRHEYREQIQALNEKDSAMLYAGETIKIYVGGTN